MRLYICQFKTIRGVGKDECINCYHSYPHIHTEGCDGGHCPQSNPNYTGDNGQFKLLHCVPLVDKKETLKRMTEKTTNKTNKTKKTKKTTKEN